MDTNKIFKCIEENLGPCQRLISGSKSGYCRSFPSNLVVFNANLIVMDTLTREAKKVWYGDIDVTNDEPMLKKIADMCDVELRVLYEMDGRFEHEDNPNISRYVYRTIHGSAEIGTAVDKYYTREAESGLIFKNKE